MDWVHDLALDIVKRIEERARERGTVVHFTNDTVNNIEDLILAHVKAQGLEKPKVIEI
jgi:hypothetical protein